MMNLMMIKIAAVQNIPNKILNSQDKILNSLDKIQKSLNKNQGHQTNQI